MKASDLLDDSPLASTLDPSLLAVIEQCATAAAAPGAPRDGATRRWDELSVRVRRNGDLDLGLPESHDALRRVVDALGATVGYLVPDRQQDRAYADPPIWEQHSVTPTTTTMPARGRLMHLLDPFRTSSTAMRIFDIVGFIELVSLGIRVFVPLHAHWWLVPEHLYLGHLQHVDSMSAGFLGALLLSVLFLLAGLRVNSGASGPSRWSRVAVACLAIGLAGGLANAFEVVAFGSATDFIGVTTSSASYARVYDLADLALYVGSFGRLLLIVGAAGRALRRRRNRTWPDGAPGAIPGWYAGPAR